MPKKSKKTGKTSASRGRSAPARSKRSVTPEVPAPSSPAAEQKFVADVLTRGDAAPLKDGKLELGKTHIIEKKKGSTKLTRARFTLA
jgi:hypothetical protein